MTKHQTITLTEQQMLDITIGNNYGAGFCTACAAEQSGCEPDAREYKCESCGEHSVYGAEELLIMGLLGITD